MIELITTIALWCGQVGPDNTQAEITRCKKFLYLCTNLSQNEIEVGECFIVELDKK